MTARRDGHLFSPRLGAIMRWTVGYVVLIAAGLLAAKGDAPVTTTSKPVKPQPLTLNAEELLRMARAVMAWEKPVRHVDEYWLAAVAQQESSGNPRAVGDGGLAVGLFQFHRPAWQDCWDRPPEDLPLRTDPWASMRAAIRYARLAGPVSGRGGLSSHHHLGHVDLGDRKYIDAVERRYQKLVKDHGGK